MRSFKVSYATLDDADLLTSHRQKMWLDIHPEWAEEVKKSHRLTSDWIKSQLSEGRLVGFIARDVRGKVAGSGCIWVREEQPRPTNSFMEIPYLMSMYTEKDYRRNGVATLIVKRALRWCRRRGYYRLVLHASKEGRALYQKLGFEDGNEMRLNL